MQIRIAFGLNFQKIGLDVKAFRIRKNYDSENRNSACQSAPMTREGSPVNPAVERRESPRHRARQRRRLPWSALQRNPVVEAQAVAVPPVCGELLICVENQQFATHRILSRFRTSFAHFTPQMRRQDQCPVPFFSSSCAGVAVVSTGRRVKLW